MAKIYEVKVVASVAKLNRGERRRAGHVFSRTPVYFRRLPKEVAADERLEKRTLSALPDGAVLADSPAAKKGAAPAA